MRTNIVALCCALVASCGPAAQPSSREGPASKTIEIVTFAFTPAEIEVPLGTELIFANRDDILHTTTSGTPKKQGVPGVSPDRPARPDGLFDEQLELDESFSFQTTKKGTFSYYCDIHSGMRGRITVV